MYVHVLMKNVIKTNVNVDLMKITKLVYSQKIQCWHKVMFQYNIWIKHLNHVLA